MIKMYIDLHRNYPYSYQILMKSEFSRQIFEEKSNIKFFENTSSRSRVVSFGRTDRRDEASSRFSNLRTRLKTLMGVLSVEIIATNGNRGMKSRVTGANMLING